MKRLLSILFLFFPFAAFSQSSNYWLQSDGGANVDENLSITKDNSGNLITTGYFTNTMTFPSGATLTAAGSGTNDVLIQKSNAVGQVLWAVKAGGPGSDRGTSVACDAAGNIYVTGYYYGAAQFGTFTLNSISNTKDIFIAKLNSSGTFLWVKSAGGSMAEDPYAITLDNLSNVIVTGQFQGTSTFGTQTLTSSTNPYTGNPSLDVFTCKYDGSGNFLWVKQGAAHLDDRGIDVGTDASGNIFVCGQFSDTITFGNTHLNQITNAVFLIKYNAAGQEQWFVRAGAISSIAYGLVVDNNNDVYITGDYTGNIIFFGTPNNTLSGTFSNRVFLVKYDNGGNYLWGKEDASSSYVSSKDVALDPNNNPCIFGEFDCKMDDYSILAGGTGMFNSVGFHDLFITQYDKNGNRQWARNFGGAYNDFAHSIVFTNNTTPYVCGSFNYKLFVNTIYNPFYILSNLFPGYDPWVSYQNCNNFDYYYYHTISAGFTDCFILHGVDGTCAYYDYYYRDGVGCKKDFVGGCIDNYAYNCPDTIKFCGPGSITTNPYTGDIGGVGPFYHYQWNTGDTMQSHSVNSSGNYSCVMTTIDGCFTSEDTVSVKINPIPLPPNITDNLGINVNQPPATTPIIICGTGTFTLTGSNLQGCTYSWSGPGIISTSGPSCVVNQAGTYYFTLTNSYGCTSNNYIDIIFTTLDHVVPKTNEPDTFTVCQGDCHLYFIYDSISNPTAINPYNPFPSLISVTTTSAVVTQCGCQSNLSLNICPTVTGWINIKVKYKFQSTCGKDSAYFNHMVYAIVKPKPPPLVITVNISGNTLLCPGDSSLLVATYTVIPNTHVSITTSVIDSFWIHSGGGFGFFVSATDTLNGCINTGYGGQSVYASTTPNPYVTMNPASGIICPNDSVKLTCTFPNAVSWQWYGPSGLLTATTSVIYEHIPGFYYCVATNSSGCQMTSNTVEIKNYNTPYLLALPQTVVCAGQTITLQVISGDTSSIVWLPPLSGGGTVRNVTVSGTYQCKVTMCGITTICTINVTIANPVATVTIHGSNVICPGDSVLLTANTGMVSYLWLPTNQMNDSIYAMASGTYLLVGTDMNGCTATDSIKVIYNPNAPPAPVTTNDSICAGNVAHLQASTTGNYSIEWYAQQYSGSVVNAGTSYTTPVLNQNTSYYVSVKDSVGCHSVRQIANVFIKLTSLMPLVWGDTLLCDGDTLNLYTSVLGGASYNWIGPNSFTSSISNPQISPVTPAVSGTYSVIINGSGCTSPTATINVLIIKVNEPTIVVANDSLCQGSTLVVQGQSSTLGVSYNWTGPNSFTSTSQTFTITNVSNVNAGTYTLQTNVGFCKSPVDSVRIIVKPMPQSSIHIKTTLCDGDSLVLSATANPTTATQSWSGPAGFTSGLASPVITPVNVSNSGYYICYTSLNGCTKKDSVKATVNPMPASLVIDTFICGNEVNINAAYSNAIKYLWNDGVINSDHTFYGSGIYWITYTLNTTCVFTDTFKIGIKENQLRDTLPNIVTPNNDNINEFVDFGKYQFTEFEVQIFNRWGTKIFESSDPKCIWRPDCVDGTYYYFIVYRISCGSENEQKALHGFITVVR